MDGEEANLSEELSTVRGDERPPRVDEANVDQGGEVASHEGDDDSERRVRGEPGVRELVGRSEVVNEQDEDGALDLSEASRSVSSLLAVLATLDEDVVKEVLEGARVIDN